MATTTTTKSTTTTTKWVAGKSKPSWAASLAMGKAKAFTFRATTNHLAKEAGWKVTMKGQTTTFSRDGKTIKATYDKGDFIQKAVGAGILIQDGKDKWGRLNKALKG